MTINVLKLTDTIYSEVARVGWSLIELRACTERFFSKRALALLSESELMQLIKYLATLPSDET